MIAIDSRRGDIAGVTWRVADVRDPALAGRLNGVDVVVHADFDLTRFEHEAFYNAPAGRVEIYIHSLMDQIVTVAGRRFMFARDERVHVEYSYKFSVAEFQALARRAGFKPVQCWTGEGLFGVHYLAVA